jgi:CxxC motif-containing protein (DUF1111 family)
VLTILLPSALLLLLLAGAVAYFPHTAKGRGPLASATDPGPRPLPATAGSFLTTLSTNEKQILPNLTAEFSRVHDVIVTSPTDGGLGPRFNSNSCASCHAYPSPGGSSPQANPLFNVYNLQGATNQMPSFITTNGPILEARFINVPGTTTPDGNVHQLFTITGRSDATGCSISQPDFQTQQQNNNLVLHQPTPMYGAGLMEVIRNSDITANWQANGTIKGQLGITGHPNYAGNDGSINRFGWKAQLRSTLLTTAQQLAVEMGVTNPVFNTEQDQTPGCVLNPIPETIENFNPNILTEMFGADYQRQELFAQWMAPPTPGPSSNSTKNGKTQFTNAGCVYCHTTSFTTPHTSRPALDSITINLYSDMLVHHMGPGLADGLAQAGSGPDEFRTSPLWGIGQRIFFMHDGRTTDIVQAIEDHYSLGNSTYPASEANQTVTNFNNLSSSNQQDLVNFLRSL